MWRKPGRTYRPLVAIAGVMVVVVAVIVVQRATIGHGAKTMSDRIRESFSGFTQVYPSAITATSSLPGHPPTAAVDGVTNTYWASEPAADGVGQVLTLQFDRPVDLRRIGLTSGASASEADFLTQPRPAEIELVFSTIFSQRTTLSVTLQDQPTFQTIRVSADQVKSLEIRIGGVHHSPTGHSVSIAELEFWATT